MGTSTTPSTCYYFGPFELDPRTGELWKSGQPVKLPPQPTKMLVFLASRGGELVTREEIKESLWGADTFVDFEQGLNFCIKKIRSALGDNPDQPEFIQTLPRRGYRFIASVQSQARNPGRKEEITDKDVSVSRSSRPWRKLLPAVALIALVILTVSYALHRHFQSVEQQHPKRIMLVVLPFQSMSDEPRQQYFSDGMTEELITQLGRMNPDRLGVIARASAEQYKRIPKSVQQIGKDLGVDYVIEGSARTDGTRVRITAQLVQGTRPDASLGEGVRPRAARHPSIAKRGREGCGERDKHRAFGQEPCANQSSRAQSHCLRSLSAGPVLLESKK